MLSDEKVYLDFNATTPIDPEVQNAMISSFNLWANPSSSYSIGKKARSQIEEARKQVALAIGCEVYSDIVFCSGGTEANNQVIHSSVTVQQQQQIFNSRFVTLTADYLPHIVT